MALVFELQTLKTIDLSKIYQLKSLELNSKDHTNFYECCELTKNIAIELRLTLSNFVILFLYKDNLLSLGRPLKFFPDIRESRELAIFKSFKSRMPAKTPSGKKPIREFSMSKIVSLVKLRTLGGSLVSQLFLM